MPEPIGLAKTAPIPVTPVTEPETTIASPSEPQPMLSTPSFEGVPVDMIRFFGKDLGSIDSKEIAQLKDINEWAKSDLTEDTIGNRLQKIRGLESRLGQPGLHESKIQKMWSWVAMQRNINELRKRQAAFER